MLQPARRSLANPSDAEWFWSITETGRHFKKAADAGREEQNAAIRDALRALPAQESVEFSALLKQAVKPLDTTDHMAACYLANGYLSDDMFNEYVNWIVSRGRSVYETATERPDTLAVLDEVIRGAVAGPETDPYCVNCDLDLIPDGVIAELTGSEPPDFYYGDRSLGSSVDWESYAWHARLPRLAAFCKASMDGLDHPGV